MEPYDLEVGPIQRTFDELFKRIAQYFNSAPVAPEGSITETDLSTYNQDQLRKTLNGILEHYGFAYLPSALKVVCETDSIISGIYRSDNITTYEEKMTDGSHRTFNFYSTYGPENMKASYYWLDMKKNGEQIQGILTEDDKWYFRIATIQGNFYYARMEQQQPYW